jgi:hypothetical protein
MKRRVSISIACALTIAHATAPGNDRIKIHNNYDKPLYVALYTGDKKSYHRTTPVTFIAQESSATLERPSLLKGGITHLVDERIVALSQEQSALKEKLSAAEYKKLISASVGITQGDTFFIAEHKGTLKIFNFLHYKALNPFIAYMENAADIIQEHLIPAPPQIKNNPYKDTVAFARKGTQPSEQEKEFLNARDAQVKRSLETALGTSLSSTPRIAFIASGGGFRCMFYTLGALMGAESIGLPFTWMVGLSGSTLALGTWMSSDKSITEHTKVLCDNVAKAGGIAKISPHDANLLIQPLIAKIMSKQPITPADIFGALLANILFREKGDQRHMVFLSEQQKQLAHGQRPLPIYTAIELNKHVTKKVWRWYEYTPFEIGTQEWGLYVPSWGYGRMFHAGVSIDYAPAQSMGLLFGTFLSALGADAEKIVEVVGQKIDPKYQPLIPLLKKLAQTGFGDTQYQQLAKKQIIPFSYAKIRNPFLGMNPLKDIKLITDSFLELVDAGIDFGFPMPPVSGIRPDRSADIIVLLDGSDTVKTVNELQKLEAYARTHGLKFPPIDYTHAGKKAISIFKDERDPACPLVIYIPCINDNTIHHQFDEPWFQAWWAKKEYPLSITALKQFDTQKCIEKDVCKTFNFEYPREKSELMVRLVECNILVHKDAIFNAVAWKLGQRSAQ